jgi:SOS-response transcriptional repressor LexA
MIKKDKQNAIQDESDRKFVSYVGMRLEELRKQHPKLTQAQAASIAGVSTRMWGIYEKGEGPMAPLDVLARFAENRGLKVIELLGGFDRQSIAEVERREVPIVDHIPAGPLSQAFGESGIIGYIMSDIRDDGAFALVVSGASMAPEIQENDIVLCSPKEPFVNGKVYAIVVGEGEQSLKRVRFDPRSESYALIPYNKEFPTLYVPKEHILKLVRVIEIRRDL